MTSTKLKARLLEFGPQVLAANVDPQMHARCIRATRLGVDTLARFGVIALPWPVICDVGNAILMQWLAEGSPGGDAEQQRRGGWLLSNDPKYTGPALPSQVDYGPGPGMPVHLVVRVPEWGCIIDLDMRQFNRPAKAIQLPAAAALPWAGDSAEGTFRSSGTAIRYRPWPDPTWKGYEGSISWAGTWIDPAVATLERLIRKGRL